MGVGGRGRGEKDPLHSTSRCSKRLIFSVIYQFERAGGRGKGGEGGAGQGRAGQCRAGRDRAGQGTARQGKGGQGRAGQGRGRQVVDTQLANNHEPAEYDGRSA